VRFVHSRERGQRPRQRLRVAGADAARFRPVEDIGRDLAAARMLREQRVDQPRRLAAGLSHDREDMLLLEHLLMIAFAERLEQCRGGGESRGVHGGGIGHQLRRDLAIGDQDPAEHAMLAHQVLVRGNRVLIATALLSVVGIVLGAPRHKQPYARKGGQCRAPILLCHAVVLHLELPFCQERENALSDAGAENKGGRSGRLGWRRLHSRAAAGRHLVRRTIAISPSTP